MTPRTSPLEPLWRTEARGTRVQLGMPVPVRCSDSAIEERRFAALGISDVSGLPRSTLKGSSSGDLLTRSGWAVPERWFEPHARPKATSAWPFVARTGRVEYWVEGDVAVDTNAPGGALIYTRQDASVLLTGARVPDLLADVLGSPVDLASPQFQFVQLARVGCALMPRPGRLPAVQLWADPTYAVYLGELLAGIAAELGGGFVGADIGVREGMLPAEA